MNSNHNDEDQHCLTDAGAVDRDRPSLFTGLYIRGKGLNADQIEAIDQNLLEMSISRTRERNGAGSICDTNLEVSIADASQRQHFGSVMKTQEDDEDRLRRPLLQSGYLDDRSFNFKTAGPEQEQAQKEAQRRQQTEFNFTFNQNMNPAPSPPTIESASEAVGEPSRIIGPGARTPTGSCEQDPKQEANVHHRSSLARQTSNALKIPMAPKSTSSKQGKLEHQLKKPREPRSHHRFKSHAAPEIQTNEMEFVNDDSSFQQLMGVHSFEDQYNAFQNYTQNVNLSMVRSKPQTCQNSGAKQHKRPNEGLMNLSLAEGKTP